MQFRTEVSIEPPVWRIEARDRLLCVGSCFAQRVGERMKECGLQADVNPWGTLYNAASVAMALREFLHDLPEEWSQVQNSKTPKIPNSNSSTDTQLPDILVVTLGTTHVFMRDGRVVANCQKLPARLFTERDLTVAEMVEDLGGAIEAVKGANPNLHVLLTVSPYRYANWSHQGRNLGLHGNQLSKARLLLAVDEIVRRLPYCAYFPAYEIVLDELRDYRFYDADMLHPSQQAVEYIWERFRDTMLSERCQTYVAEMESVRKALGHRPRNPDSDEYRLFIDSVRQKQAAIMSRFL